MRETGKHKQALTCNYYKVHMIVTFLFEEKKIEKNMKEKSSQH